MNEDVPKFYDDNGTEFNPDLMPKPDLCISCRKDGMSGEEIFCGIAREDQEGEDEFECFAYEPINVNNND